jgi:RNA polymerase sigma-70 factor (ECF subfamily)
MSVDVVTDPETWVDRHGDCLYRYALLRLRSPEVAADLVQDTFLEALRARRTFLGRSSERTWLVGILRHKIVDHVRRTARHPASVNGPSPSASPDSPFDRRGRWRVGPAHWGADPSRALECGEFWEVFDCCLSKLPPGIADAFLLRELDGLPAADVQELLGITPTSLWKRLQRARVQLRQCLESGWFGRGTKASGPRISEPKGRSGS